MILFDTHVHLDDEQFDTRRDRIIQRAVTAGVASIVAVGTSAASSRQCVELANRFECVYAAVGIQPNYCGEADSEDWRRVAEMATASRVVAVGETGLDRHWDFTPWDVQQDYFDRHLQLAQQCDLPVVIHMRDCQREMVAALERAGQRKAVRGVMHSFTGDSETAARCIEIGLHISFAGMVTYKKSDALRAVAATIPTDRLLVETDAPYLSPHPKRGQRPNEPALIVHTAQCLADVRGTDVELLARQTTDNARRLFRVAD